MASIKTFAGVAHDIAHHSQSSLSWLHPHLGQACRLAGVNTAVIDLLSQQPYPASLPKLKPLELALSSLQARFWEIVELKRLSRDCIAYAQLKFFFPPNYDDYSCSVSATITTSHGNVFTRKVDISW